MLGKILVIAGIVAGNFLYQLIIGEPNWLVATERSWFQVWGILFYIWMTK